MRIAIKQTEASSVQQAAPPHDNKRAQRQEEAPQSRIWGQRAAGSGRAWHHSSSQRQLKPACIMRQQHNRGCGSQEHHHGGRGTTKTQERPSNSRAAPQQGTDLLCTGQGAARCPTSAHFSATCSTASWMPCYGCGHRGVRVLMCSLHLAAPLRPWLYARSTQLQSGIKLCAPSPGQHWQHCTPGA